MDGKSRFDTARNHVKQTFPVVKPARGHCNRSPIVLHWGYRPKCGRGRPLVCVGSLVAGGYRVV